MKWKLLLLLALFSVSVVVAQSDEVSEKLVKPKSDDESVTDEDDSTYVDEDEETPAVIEDAAVVDPEDPIINEPEAFEAMVDEDTVDINVKDVKARKGDLYNYEDYFLQSALDASDNNYNWNGELNGLSMGISHFKAFVLS